MLLHSLYLRCIHVHGMWVCVCVCLASGQQRSKRQMLSGKQHEDMHGTVLGCRVMSLWCLGLLHIKVDSFICCY
jgi:hypothetical protein